jgi:hypothetical protein
MLLSHLRSHQLATLAHWRALLLLLGTGRCCAAGGCGLACFVQHGHAYGSDLPVDGVLLLLLLGPLQAELQACELHQVLHMCHWHPLLHQVPALPAPPLLLLLLPLLLGSAAHTLCLEMGQATPLPVLPGLPLSTAALRRPSLLQVLLLLQHRCA